MGPATVPGMINLPLNRREAAIVNLALRMIHKAAMAKSDFEEEAAVLDIIVRLNAARPEED